MAEYLSPGVYIEEIDAGPRPIAGVSTSTAGMAGVTVRGPYTGKPKLVTNFLEFQNTFGGFLREPDPLIRDTWANDPAEGGRWWLFPLAVKGFFDNGGQRLYIKRVASKQASPSSGGAGPRPGEPRHRRFRAGRGDYVQIGTRGAEQTLEFAAVSPGSWGDAVRVRIQPMASATLPVLPDPQEGGLFVTRLAADAAADSETVEVAAVTGLDPDELPPDVWVQIGGPP